ncbi:MAG: Aerobic glycerol-3-phosphate dehydrogenase [Chlamydiia bacterium]|nr:Aerobic glycerol-3-phosphate dehydrogenase [Chlamydiia bacterium]
MLLLIGCSKETHNKEEKVLPDGKQISRAETRKALESKEYDVLIIGGGAAGAGAALDAANRGASVALIERSDFASGTSSKSTKLAHGGVRYLEKAVLNLDKKQYDLVLEALSERANLFKMAPYLVKPLEIVTPLYHYWEIPYYWIGLKVYDWIAGAGSLHRSEYVSAKTIAKKIPSIKRTSLLGGVSYYDGQFNDTRLNIALVQSAVALGGKALNYAEVKNLIKDSETKQLIGVVVKDHITKDEFEIRSKVVINAAGPSVDVIRQMDDSQARPLINASSGTHLILSRDLMPSNTGVLVPKTKDGRILFLLPWEGKTLVGTTDNKTSVSYDVFPSSSDLDYLLSYVKEQLNVPIDRSDIQSAWTGLRPLVSDPSAKNTQSIVRNHYIEKSSSGLITISGGKWTTFRKMSEDVVDIAMEPSERKTSQLRLVGTRGFHSDLVDDLEIERDIAEHLASSYGGLAKTVLSYGNNERLVRGHPIIVSEVHYAIDRELAMKPLDVLSRRTRLATLDARAAKKALPKVVAIMQEKLHWTSLQAAYEMQEALAELSKYIPSEEGM